MRDQLQYYPTGVRTAAKAWAKFRRPVRHLCDPSAGKGHLIRHAQEGFPGVPDEELPWVAKIADTEVQEGRFRTRVRDYARMKFSGLKEVSAIEIDIQHHSSLKELGAKIIGYDFLQVSSLATVSNLIMNPPFQQGCAHVLHAWDVLYDAELVAIINAETIRNPFSQDRQRLCSLIESHGSVEFLQDEFTDEVERMTSVEIALIYLEKIPGQYLDVDALMGNLKRGDNRYSEIDVDTCNALALPGNFIQDTCFRFEQAVAAARRASEAIAISDHLSAGLGVTLEEMQTKGVGSDFREVSGSIREAANNDFKVRYDDLKKRAWAQILRSTLLTDKLSNQARRKVEASSQEIYNLEFNAANIHGFLSGVAQSLGDIYQEMILMLFDSIIERSSDNAVFYRSWKSNQKHRIGMRLRKTRFILPRFRVGFSNNLDYEDERFLADIDKAFHYLHGGVGEFDGLVQACRKNPLGTGERFSSRYFEFRHYKAGTMHFYPKSEEVMNKLNRFVGRLRNWLPGDMEEANSDFKKQYEKGESFTEEYLAACRKARTSYYDRDNQAYKLLRSVQGKDFGEGTPELDRLEQAIDLIHEKHGLHCGPALTGTTASTAIAYQPQIEEGAPRSTTNEPEQLLLLAA